jgi:putative transposase
VQALRFKHRFNLSLRDIKGLQAARVITVSHEAIQLWCIRFGCIYAQRLKRKYRGYIGVFYADEVVDDYLQAAHDGAAATLFFRRLKRSHGEEPRKVVTDKLLAMALHIVSTCPRHSTKLENMRII